MSLRRGILILVIGVIATLIVTRSFEKVLLAMNVLSESRQALIEDAQHSLSYVVDDERWTRFELPSGYEQVKLETNAICRRGAVLPDEQVRYALRYRVLRGDSIAKEGVYHVRSARPDLVTDAAGIVSDRMFFLESEYQPTATRSFRLDLSLLDPGKVGIHLRLEEKSPSMEEALVRVFYLRRFTPAQQQFRWDRLTKRKREKISRKHIYTPDLFDDIDKLAYSRNEWAGVAPPGVVGRDYEMRIVYKRAEDDADERSLDEVITGLRVGPDLRGTIRLPPEGTPIDLVFDRPDPYVARRAPAPIRLSWYARDGSIRESDRLFVAGPSVTANYVSKGEMLEISSEQLVLVRAFLEDKVEITPESSHLRAFTMDAGEELDYFVAHPGERATDFRFDVRGVDTTPFGLSACGIDVEYEFHDENRLLRSGRLESKKPVSSYDEASGGATFERVTDPVRWFFQLGADVRRVVLRNVGSPAVVSAFNRLDGETREVVVPDGSAPADDFDPSSALWFTVQPSRASILKLEGRSRSIRYQTRPFSEGNARDFDEYRAATLFPVTDWIGTPILVPYEAKWVDERGLAESYYTELPVGAEFPVVVLGSRSSASVTSQIAIIARATGSWSLRLGIEDSEPRTYSGSGQGAMVPIDRLKTGPQRWHVESNGRVFANRVALEAGVSYLRRIAVQVDGRPLHFRCEKRDFGDLSLNGAVFFEGGDSRSVSVCVEITGSEPRLEGPTEVFSFLRRRFEIVPKSDAAVVSIGADWRLWSPPHRFVVPLRRDLPPGEYRIALTFPPEWRGLFTLVEYALEKRAIFRLEKSDDPDDSES
jgi:hypothetical protein